MTKYAILTDILGFDPAARLSENTSDDDDLETRNATEDVIDTLVDSEKECFVEEQFLLIDKTIDNISQLIMPVDISDFMSSMDSSGVEDAQKASSEVPLISPLFLRRTLHNEMREIVEKISDLKSRNQTVDKKLKLIQNEIETEKNSGNDGLPIFALTREKEACQKMILELAAKLKRLMKEREKDAVSKEMCDNAVKEQKLSSLNIPYLEETLLKSSKGNSRQITSSVFSTISSGAAGVIAALQDMSEAQDDDEEDALILQISQLLQN